MFGRKKAKEEPQAWVPGPGTPTVNRDGSFTMCVRLTGGGISMVSGSRLPKPGEKLSIQTTHPSSAYRRTEFTDSQGNALYDFEGSTTFYRLVRNDKTNTYHAYSRLVESGCDWYDLGNPGSLVYEAINKTEHDRIVRIMTEMLQRGIDEYQAMIEREASAAIARQELDFQHLNPPISIQKPSATTLQKIQSFIEDAIRNGKTYDQALSAAYEEFSHSLVNQATGRS